MSKKRPHTSKATKPRSQVSVSGDSSTVSESVSAAAPNKKLNAVWTAADDATLVAVLEHQFNAGQRGDNGFKRAAWTAAAKELAGAKVGKQKTPDGCRDHWKLLQKEYSAVHWLLTKVSGFGWDGERNVVTAPDDVWEELLQTRPDFGKWRSKAFPLYDRIGGLVDGVLATGQDAVRVSSGEVVVESSEVSQTDIIVPVQSQPKTPDHHTQRSRSRSIESIALLTRDGKRGRSHSRSRSSSPTPTASAKRGRISGPMAVNNMAEAVAQVASTFGMTATEIATPTRRAKAVRLVSKDYSLTQEVRICAIRLFTKDIAVCDSYLAIDDTTLRNEFLSAILDTV